MQINIDFETRSTIDLKTAGAHLYAADPTTEIMCMAWSIDGCPSQLWWPWQSFPGHLAEHIRNGAEIHAWNAAFERLIWPILERSHGVPPVKLEQWRCTMVRALLLGFPASLDNAAPSMGLAESKDKGGHSLMLRMSKPRKIFYPTDPRYDEYLELAEEGRLEEEGLAEFTTFGRDGRHLVAQWWVDPDRLAALGQYCRKDVTVERLAGAFLDPIPNYELEGWQMDQRINDRGFYIDMGLVHKARDLVKPAIQVANKKLANLTDGALKSVTQPNTIRAWLGDRLGLELDSIGKEVLSVLLAEHPSLAGEEPKDPTAKAVIDLRLVAAKTSTAKLNALLRGTGKDQLFRGGLQYAGAGRTSRYAGRRFQPQNLPRPEWWAEEAIPLVMEGNVRKIELLLGNALEAISSILRSCITARPGNELTVADYNAIEARVAAWLSGCFKILDAYATGKDPYRIMAATIFGYADWTEVPKGGIERFLGKKLILGAQYGLGKKRFWESCREDGLFIEFDLAEKSINAYREDNWEIKAAWGALDTAAVSAMQNPYTWVPCLDRKIYFFRDDKYLRMRLPSGRLLSYLYPKLQQDVTPWGKETYKVLFWGWNGMKNRMEWQTMWGGRWMENACQAISRDLLIDAMKRLEQKGWRIILSVHDELLTDNPIGERTSRELENEMALAPPWADGLPLKVEGWTGPRYRK